MSDEDSTVPLIILVVIFYIAGLAIAIYIRIRRNFLIKQIQKTGRVISLSSTLISAILQQMHQQQRTHQISPATGLPAPPAYSIEVPNDDPPPPYTPPPSQNHPHPPLPPLSLRSPPPYTIK